MYSQKTSFTKFLLLTFVVTAAVVLRIYYLYILYPLDKYIFSDMQIYVDNAKAIVTGIPAAQVLSKPPFYEWLIALSFKCYIWKLSSSPFAFIQGLQFLLSLAIPFLLAYSCKRWAGKKTALVVLIVGLFYFPFIEYAGLLMAEIPFAFLLAVMALLITKFAFPWKPYKAILIGAVWAASLFFKGQSLFFLPIAFLYSMAWWWKKHRKNFKPKYIVICKAWLFFLVGSLTVYFSQAATKKWILHTPDKFPSVAALNYAYARCDNCRMFIDSKGAWTCASKFHLVGGCNKECRFPAPFEDSAFFWKQGNTCLIENPTNILTSLSEISSLFVGNEAFPFMEITELRMLNRNWELFFQLFILPAIIFGFIWRLNWKGSQRVGIVHCLALSIFALAYVLTGDVRYRIPFDVVFLPLAIATWVKFISRFNLKAFSR